MALYPKGKGKISLSTAGSYPIKDGPGTLVFLSFLGGASARVDFYDGDAIPANAIASYHGLNTTIPFSANPFLSFETSLTMVTSGTFTGALVSLTVE